jgi:glycosyltransferase involved in cell wall biosynthesis
MRLSVVLPCRDAAATIGLQLDALARQALDAPWELIVVDDCSTDATPSIVTGYEDRLPLRIVRAGDRGGSARARNVGAREARGKNLVFCDADDIVAQGWLAEMHDALEEHEVVASCPEYELLNEPWARAPREEIDGLPRLPFPPHLSFASTFGLGVRRARHDAIGGFDESLPALHDVDYSIRLQLAGARLHYAPGAVVHYRNRDTIPAIYRQAAAYATDMACIQRRFGQPTGRRWRWPLRGWRGIARAAARANTRSGRACTAWALGWQVGRLRGSLRFRVLAV